MRTVRRFPRSSHSCLFDATLQKRSGTSPRIRRQRQTGSTLCPIDQRQTIGCANHTCRPMADPVNDCLTPLHTMQKCRLKINHRFLAQVFYQSRIKSYSLYFSNTYMQLLTKKALARSLRHSLRASPDRRSPVLAAVHPPKGAGTWILAGFQDDIFCKEALR